MIDVGVKASRGAMRIGIFLSLSLHWGAWSIEGKIEREDVRVSPALKEVRPINYELNYVFE